MTTGETDAFEVYAQLQPVAERWRFLGLALGLPGNALSTIGAKQATADEYLLDVILQLLKNNKLTWEKIVDAVKNPAGGNNTALTSNISKDKVYIDPSYKILQVNKKFFENLKRGI